MSLLNSAANRVKAGAIEKKIAGVIVDALKKEFADDAWCWFNAHKNDRIGPLGIARVKHIRSIFVMLFGPEPSAEAPQS